MKDTSGLATLPTAVRRVLVWSCQSCLILCALWLSFLFRFDLRIPALLWESLLVALPVWLVGKTLTFRWLKLDRGWLLGLLFPDAVRVFVGGAVASCVCVLALFVMRIPIPPRSVCILDAILCPSILIAFRAAFRFFSTHYWPIGGEAVRKQSVLIYGAGQAGLLLVSEIWRNRSLPYHVSGFIDDAPDKEGLHIAGIKVLGNGKSMSKWVPKLGIEKVLIAIPSATGLQMSTILQCCRDCGVECKTVPGLAEMIGSRGLAGQIRDVAVEDLLGRTPVKLDEDRIRESIGGKVILVTGAGGSIGSELCRQIARFKPAAIVGYECAESALFDIEQEMRREHSNIPFFAEIGSIQNRRRFDEVVSRYLPSAIYHAAAYKHVPLMETHAFEAIENNVFGTWNVVMSAHEYGVRDFVLISSDKAVRPTNVMGATKRLTELIVLGMLSSRTKFVAVRFGNVLGSNGSVIPTFKRQIAAGGPVTVTHPEMRRFFMTIPEACQLVLQSAVIGSSGEICVLDMGQPIRIVDLARNLILLSGLRPDHDVPIEFTVIRPGEKLYEELFFSSENAYQTDHPKVLRAKNGVLPIGLSTVVDLLVDGARRGWSDDQLRNLLGRLVPAFRVPAHEVEAEVDLPISSLPR